MDKQTTMKILVALGEQLDRLIATQRGYAERGSANLAEMYLNQIGGVSASIDLVRKLASINFEEYIDALVAADEADEAAQKRSKQHGAAAPLIYSRRALTMESDMNKIETERAVKAAEKFKKRFQTDALAELLEYCEEATDELQEKIDRIESMDNIGDTLQERLDTYNLRMEAMETMKEQLEAIQDAFSDFEDAATDLENTI